MQGYLTPNRLDLTIRQNREYSYSYCGLCQGLKEDYGQLARFLVNKDALFLQLLTEAQLLDVPEQQKIRCGVRPGAHLSQSYPKAAKFAAAVTIIMAWGKLSDTVNDAKGFFNFSARKTAELQLWLGQNKVKKAEKVLQELGFDVQMIYHLFEKQQQMEQLRSFENLEEIASLTAQGLSALFAHTATLANNQSNFETLKAIGSEVGAILYLLDTKDDLAMDIKKRRFNPLHVVSTNQTSISESSPNILEELSTILNKKHEAIIANLANFKALQHDALLENIFISGLKNQIARILNDQNETKEPFGDSVFKMRLAGQCEEACSAGCG